MPWKESYKTRTGQKRYKIVTQDAAGKKTSKSFDRSKDADSYLLELKRKEQLGHLWQDDPETFGAFAGLTFDGHVKLTGDGWFTRYKTNVKPSTYDRRVDVIGHLRELLDMRLDRITVVQVEELVGSLQEEHPRQAKFLHETIQMILRGAKVRGQLVNPDVLDLKPPRYTPKRKRQALTGAQVEALAEASSEPHLIRLGAWTGLRPGELCALRDEDIDLEAQQLHVTGTVYKRERQPTPKTDAGWRTVPLTDAAVREIKLQRLRRVAGETILFPGPKGGYWLENYFEREFKSWATECGLDITPHDLRSTFASFMVKAKVHPKILQGLMGHESFETTMRLYAKYDDTDAKAAIASLGDLLEGAG